MGCLHAVNTPICLERINEACQPTIEARELSMVIFITSRNQGQFAKTVCSANVHFGMGREQWSSVLIFYRCDLDSLLWPLDMENCVSNNANFPDPLVPIIEYPVREEREGNPSRVF